MNVVNFAHGEFYTFGAYAVFAALVGASVNFFVAIPVAVVVGAAAGALCERCLLRPLRGESIDTVMLVMIGVWIAMQNAELLGWGGVAKSVPTPFPTQPVVWGHVSASPLRLFVFPVSGPMILARIFSWLRTKLGRAMRDVPGSRVSPRSWAWRRADRYRHPRARLRLAAAAGAARAGLPGLPSMGISRRLASRS
jgi:branched-chain amino acid transport system permease protein